MADLRFATSEAPEFLNEVMALDLSAENVSALEMRTEGWIAGLQMAALAMRGHVASKIHSAVARIAGSWGSGRLEIRNLAARYFVPN